MNNLKKIFLLTGILTSAFCNNYGMEVGEIGISQIGDIPLATFETLPKDIKRKLILNIVEDSANLNEVVKDLRSISLINRELNNLINNPVTIQAIINVLKEKNQKRESEIKEDWLYALSLISIPGARRLLQSKIDENNINEVISQLINNAQNFDKALKNLHHLTKNNTKLNESINNQSKIETILKLFQAKVRKKGIASAQKWHFALFLHSLPGAKNWLTDLLIQENVTIKEINKFIANLYLGETHPNIDNAVIREPIISGIIQTYLELTNNNINFQDTDGNTLLMYAVMQDNVELVKYLLTQPEINLALKNKKKTLFGKSKTALQIANELGNKEIIKLLEQHKK
ncbi:MAG: ankyrin repeat domain-containing protein [Candidatus Babeliales bacterium]